MFLLFWVSIGSTCLSGKRVGSVVVESSQKFNGTSSVPW